MKSLERDPGLRTQIWDYSVAQQDEIRRAYITTTCMKLNFHHIYLMMKNILIDFNHRGSLYFVHD